MICGLKWPQETYGWWMDAFDWEGTLFLRFEPVLCLQAYEGQCTNFGARRWNGQSFIIVQLLHQVINDKSNANLPRFCESSCLQR